MTSRRSFVFALTLFTSTIDNHYTKISYSSWRIQLHNLGFGRWSLTLSCRCWPPFRSHLVDSNSWGCVLGYVQPQKSSWKKIVQLFGNIKWVFPHTDDLIIVGDNDHKNKRKKKSYPGKFFKIFPSLNSWGLWKCWILFMVQTRRSDMKHVKNHWNSLKFLHTPWSIGLAAFLEVVSRWFKLLFWGERFVAFYVILNT